jgi:hypothetical protein
MLYHVAAFCFACDVLPLFEIASVLVRLDHIARFVVNANHGNGISISSLEQCHPHFT